MSNQTHHANHLLGMLTFLLRKGLESHGGGPIREFVSDGPWEVWYEQADPEVVEAFDDALMNHDWMASYVERSGRDVHQAMLTDIYGSPRSYHGDNPYHRVRDNPFEIKVDPTDEFADEYGWSPLWDQVDQDQPLVEQIQHAYHIKVIDEMVEAIHDALDPVTTDLDELDYCIRVVDPTNFTWAEMRSRLHFGERFCEELEDEHRLSTYDITFADEPVLNELISLEFDLEAFNRFESPSIDVTLNPNGEFDLEMEGDRADADKPATSGDEEGSPPTSDRSEEHQEPPPDRVKQMFNDLYDTIRYRYNTDPDQERQLSYSPVVRLQCDQERFDGLCNINDEINGSNNGVDRKKDRLPASLSFSSRDRLADRIFPKLVTPQHSEIRYFSKPIVDIEFDEVFWSNDPLEDPSDAYSITWNPVGDKYEHLEMSPDDGLEYLDHLPGETSDEVANDLLKQIKHEVHEMAQNQANASDQDEVTVGVQFDHTTDELDWMSKGWGTDESSETFLEPSQEAESLEDVVVADADDPEGFFDDRDVDVVCKAHVSRVDMDTSRENMQSTEKWGDTPWVWEVSDREVIHNDEDADASSQEVDSISRSHSLTPSSHPDHPGVDVRDENWLPTKGAVASQLIYDLQKTIRRWCRNPDTEPHDDHGPACLYIDAPDELVDDVLGGVCSRCIEELQALLDNHAGLDSDIYTPDDGPIGSPDVPRIAIKVGLHQSGTEPPYTISIDPTYDDPAHRACPDVVGTTIQTVDDFERQFEQRTDSRSREKFAQEIMAHLQAVLPSERNFDFDQDRLLCLNVEPALIEHLRDCVSDRFLESMPRPDPSTKYAQDWVVCRGHDVSRSIEEDVEHCQVYQLKALFEPDPSFESERPFDRPSFGDEAPFDRMASWDWVMSSRSEDVDEVFEQLDLTWEENVFEQLDLTWEENSVPPSDEDQADEDVREGDQTDENVQEGSAVDESQADDALPNDSDDLDATPTAETEEASGSATNPSGEIVSPGDGTRTREQAGEFVSQFADHLREVRGHSVQLEPTSKTLESLQEVRYAARAISSFEATLHAESGLDIKLDSPSSFDDMSDDLTIDQDLDSFIDQLAERTDYTPVQLRAMHQHLEAEMDEDTELDPQGALLAAYETGHLDEADNGARSPGGGTVVDALKRGALAGGVSTAANYLLNIAQKLFPDDSPVAEYIFETDWGRHGTKIMAAIGVYKAAEHYPDRVPYAGRTQWLAEQVIEHESAQLARRELENLMVHIREFAGIAASQFQGGDIIDAPTSEIDRPGLPQGADSGDGFEDIGPREESASREDTSSQG